MANEIIRLKHCSISDSSPTFFIADIASNHDGNLNRAKKLIRLAAKSGADAAKFQNFRAQNIVSKQGFAALGGQVSHQSKWEKSVYEVYQDASIPWEWTKTLKEECDAVGIEYLSTPYDLGSVDMLEPYVLLYKIGSGDITWKELLQKVAMKGKPVMLATGASDIGEVQRAVKEILQHNQHLILMQCNTNYSGDLDNYRYVNLNVLKTYKDMFPEAILGLSDHTPGDSAVLGAVSLGARVIEKHFTDDNKRNGPDHGFSMTPHSWKEMVERTRQLEYSLGEGCKRVQKNEIETVIVQRRCIRASMDLTKDTIINRDHISVLRPAPNNSLSPYEIDKIIGMKLRKDVCEGEAIWWSILE